MRTGKLAISRGYQLPAPAKEDGPHLALVPQQEPKAEIEPVLPPPPGSSDYQLVHDRLTALERLTRLFEHGALTAEEFAAEKVLILGRPSDEIVLREMAPVDCTPARLPSPRPGPSLVGRMLSWKFLLASLAIGSGLSFVAQPDATLQAFDQMARYLRG